MGIQRQIFQLKTCFTSACRATILVIACMTGALSVADDTIEPSQSKQSSNMTTNCGNACPACKEDDKTSGCNPSEAARRCCPNLAARSCGGRGNGCGAPPSVPPTRSCRDTAWENLELEKKCQLRGMDESLQNAKDTIGTFGRMAACRQPTNPLARFICNRLGGGSNPMRNYKTQQNIMKSAEECRDFYNKCAAQAPYKDLKDTKDKSLWDKVEAFNNTIDRLMRLEADILQTFPPYCWPGESCEVVSLFFRNQWISEYLQIIQNDTAEMHLAKLYNDIASDPAYAEYLGEFRSAYTYAQAERGALEISVVEMEFNCFRYTTPPGATNVAEERLAKTYSYLDPWFNYSTGYIARRPQKTNFDGGWRLAIIAEADPAEYNFDWQRTIAIDIYGAVDDSSPELLYSLPHKQIHEFTTDFTHVDHYQIMIRGGTGWHTLTCVAQPINETLYSADAIRLVPSEGPLKGGDDVLIEGVGLGGVTSVVFSPGVPGAGDITITNGVAVNESGTQVYFTAPDLSAFGPGPIASTVTIREGECHEDLVFGSGMIYVSRDPTVNRPELLDVEPKSAIMHGGQEIRVFGKHLADLVAVRLGSVTIGAEDLAINADGTSVTFVAPEHPFGTVELRATSERSGSSNALPFAFDWLPGDVDGDAVLNSADIRAVIEGWQITHFEEHLEYVADAWPWG